MSTLANAAEIPATEMPATVTPATVTPPSETPAIKAPAIKAPTSSVRAPRARAPERDHRIVNQPGFVLHSYPYKETSLIIDLFSRDHGRVALVAKGAKRPHSKLRGVLQTFQPLQLAWVGKSEVRTLVSAEWVGGLLPLEGAALLCGFYLNELLVKLLARDDPHAPLFDHYMSALNQLAHDEPPAIVLRKFELSLLKETGVAGNLAVCAQTGQPVDVEKTYVIDPERGARASLASDTSPSVTGKTLLDMEAGDYSDSTTQLQSKFLMRHLLSHHLGGMPLNTRQILIDLLQL
jgi:DNA repair protein RecO (recombination protein O)